MNEKQEYLYTAIQHALKKWRFALLMRGLALTLFAAVVFFGLFVLASVFWTELPWLVPAVLVAGTAGLTYVVFRFILRPWRRKVTVQQVARSVEERNPALEDRLVTALHSQHSGGGISRDWLDRVIEDALQHVRDIEFEKQLPVRGDLFWRSLFGVALVLLLVILFNRVNWQGPVNLVLQSGFVPPQPLPALYVQPGNTKVRKGGSLDITATVKNIDEQQALLYFSTDDSTWQTAELEATAGPGSDLHYQFLSVETPMRYYLRAGDLISDIFVVDVYDAPSVQRIDLTYRFPKATGLPRRFERDGGDIWAPAGTRVTVKVLVHNPFAQALLIVGEGKPREMKILSDSTAAASLVVRSDGFYRIRLISPENLDNRPEPEYFIRALKNAEPTVTLKRPGRDVKATMIEEIPVVVDVGDDFGLQSVDLALTVNSRDEQIFPFENIRKDRRTSLSFDTQTLSTLIQLEDLQVEPGDFVSYYVMARDVASQEPALSEIFYIEVINFEHIYRQATSQAAQGGGGQSSMSLPQKDIITATTRLLRRKKAIPADEYEANLGNLEQAQADVRETIERVVSRARMRSRFVRDASGQVIRELEIATEEMKKAEPLIGADSLQQALVHERAAYNRLLRADALVRERQIVNTRGSGRSATPQTQDELARMFQDELDNMKSKYETLGQQSREQAQQEINEALRKIQELAKRQQQLNKQNELLAQQNLSEQEKKRRIKKLQRQQEQLNRDTQNMMQRLQDSLSKQKDASAREAMDELRKASSSMNRATNRLRREQTEGALAAGRQARERLRKIEKQLQRSRSNALKNDLSSLKDEFAGMGEQQKRLQEKTRRLQKQQREGDRSDSLRQAVNELRRQQDALRSKLQASLQELQKITRRELSAGSTAKDREREEQLARLQREIKRLGLEGKMRQASSALRQQNLEKAGQVQKRIAEALNKANRELASASAQQNLSEEKKLEMALDQTRSIREQIEQALNEKSAGNEQGEQSSGEASGAATGRSTLSPEQISRLREELWKSKEKLEKLRKMLPENSSLDKQGRQLMNALQGVLRQNAGGSPQRLDEIEAGLLQRLLKIEAELAAQLQILLNKESLRTVQDEQIPVRYRELVEEYYRSIADEGKK